jgi:hypothetical protein
MDKCWGGGKVVIRWGGGRHMLHALTRARRGETGSGRRSMNHETKSERGAQWIDGNGGTLKRQALVIPRKHMGVMWEASPRTTNLLQVLSS